MNLLLFWTRKCSSLAEAAEIHIFRSRRSLDFISTAYHIKVRLSDINVDFTVASTVFNTTELAYCKGGRIVSFSSPHNGITVSKKCLSDLHVCVPLKQSRKRQYNLHTNHFSTFENLPIITISSFIFITVIFSCTVLLTETLSKGDWPYKWSKRTRAKNY